MSNVSIRVELPGHSHSFVVELAYKSTVSHIKAEIAAKCAGGPRVDGQRLIFAGRVLKDDEKIPDIWPSPQEPFTIHLAVHPSAWTTNPPDRVTATHSTSSFTHMMSSDQQQPHSGLSPPSPMSFPSFSSQYHINSPSLPSGPAISSHPYIIHKHECALAALEKNSCAGMPSYHPNIAEIARRSAISSLSMYGWSWPEIFDEPLPISNEGEGVRYERVVLEGQSYLSLTTPHAKPSALQLHALKTLGYTYSILLMPPPTPVSYNPYYPYTVAAGQYIMPPAGAQNLNDRLQHLGIPPIRVAQNGLAAAQLRAFPLRALMLPLIMLSIRTALLVYFFAPSKSPIFGVVIALWISYEAWNTIRGAMRPARARAAREAVAAPPGANVAGAQGQNGAAPVAAAASNHDRDHSGVFLDTLANVNLVAENDALSATGNIPTEPGVLHKVQTFLLLLVTTVHPALWNRRRAELMRREGRIRTEATALQSENDSTDAPEGEASADVERRNQARNNLREQHARRPVWVREYVDRVRNTEFTDE